MKIYFNGDSNVAGSELAHPETESFASKLAKRLNATEYRNDATHSASNWRIFQTTEDYLRDCNGNYPDFIVIGWTEVFREDWYHDGEYRSVQGPGLDLSIVRDTDPWVYWKEKMTKNYQYRHQMAKFYNRMIHNLHLKLLDLKINHLFFNAIDCFTSFEYSSDDPIFRLDWGKNYHEPYTHKKNWRDWAEENKYEQITPGWYHYKEPCQEAWAEIIHNYIKEVNLL